MHAVIRFFRSLVKQEHCAHKFALSFCIGVYIAFSPFIGLHTVMVFLFSWFFTLNTAIMFAVSLSINNPWTMIPVYGVGYVVGEWLFKLVGIDSVYWNPWWYNLLLKTSHYYANISLWPFLIGGNLLGLGIGSLLYPLMRHVFSCYTTIES